MAAAAQEPEDYAPTEIHGPISTNPRSQEAEHGVEKKQRVFIIKPAAGLLELTDQLRTMKDLDELAAFGHSSPADQARGSKAPNPGDVEDDRLLLDSGAAINAVSELFKNLRDIKYFAAPMWATLPDGSRLLIRGIGAIHSDFGFSIPSVYAVEGLKKNLISVSQLDREHGLCCCFHSNKCEVMDKDGTVVGGAILEDDGLYVLRGLEVPN